MLFFTHNNFLKKKVLTHTFKSTTTRDQVGKNYKLAPCVQRIGGLRNEDPNNIPSLYQYNPSFASVESRIKGNVKYKLHLKGTKELQKKKKLINKYVSDLNKRLAIKDTRSGYIHSILTKFHKYKRNLQPDPRSRSVKKEIFQQNKSFSRENSDFSSQKVYKNSKIVSINSKSVMRERKQSNVEANNYQSLPQLQAKKPSSTETSKPIKRIHMSSK